MTEDIRKALLNLRARQESGEHMPCPRCGKNIIDNGNTPLTGTCLYCGAVVRFPPHFDLGNKNGQPQEPTLDPTLDPTQDSTQ